MNSFHYEIPENLLNSRLVDRLLTTQDAVVRVDERARRSFPDPIEQRDFEGNLKLCDLPRQCRLREADLAGRRRQRAGVRGGAERTRKVPVDRIHTNS